jgi:hypothetical protein
LNDYKAMYGILFEEELKPYSHWGWFDPDILLGPNFKDVVLEYLHADYDVITFPDGAITVQSRIITVVIVLRHASA